MSRKCKKPIISIITTVLNDKKNLEKTIQSVIDQNYPNIEYIIIDGGSTDGTIDIIKKYEYFVSYWVSEPDKGISDAFNKGIHIARGDYINFQGAGDFLFDNQVISKMMHNVDMNSDWLVCGKIHRITESGKVLWTTSSKFYKTLLLFKMSLPHQALFTNRKYFDTYGQFDTHLKFSMDYDLILRSYNTFPGVKMKNQVVSCWQEGGIGSNRFLEIFDEYHYIKKKNKVASYFTLYLIHQWILLKYRLSKKLSFKK